MAKQSIMRIAEAENAAEAAEARAKAGGEMILRDAEAEAKRIREAAKINAQKIIDARIGRAESEAAAIEKDAVLDARRGAAVLVKNAANAREKAVNMVMDALVSERG